MIFYEREFEPFVPGILFSLVAIIITITMMMVVGKMYVYGTLNMHCGMAR